MPFLWVLDFTRSLNHTQLPSLWHPQTLSDRWLAPPGPMVWTRCCDDKTLLAAIRERREQSSISPSSNPRSSIDFPRMRNGRQEKAQSDIPMGPVAACVRACVCVCVCERNNRGHVGAETRYWDKVNTFAIHSLYAYMMVSNSVVYWGVRWKMTWVFKSMLCCPAQIKWRRRQSRRKIPEGQINLTSHQLHGASLDSSSTSSN